MTQEDKQLLLQDLCARLPYETKVYWENCDYGDKVKNLVSIDEFGMVNDEFPIEECKPYLRPMSDMTEEEKKEYGKICELDTEILANHPMNGEPFPALYNSQDWLNKKMFDFRGLIPKGRAIAVTKENNPYKG